MARTFVADYTKAPGREDLSTLVRQGAGEDFPEIRIADDLLARDVLAGRPAFFHRD